MTRSAPWSFDAVPAAAVRLYQLAWQLEVWLRLIATVELRAATADWEAPLRRLCRTWPPRLQASDKRLHHMATSHDEGLSYLSLGELWRVIAEPSSFPLFEPYFPPHSHTVVRMEEALTIRNRIAHFREPHEHDEDRFALLLKDLVPGLRRFCARYNRESWLGEGEEDDVAAIIASSWDRCGHAVELRGPKGWLYAPGHHRFDPRGHVTLTRHTHGRHRRGHPEGVLYKCAFSPRHGGSLDMQNFLEVASWRHRKLVVHLLVDLDHVAVVVPAVDGAEIVAATVLDFIDTCRNNIELRSPRPPDPAEWPEHVLWPNHPLNIFAGDSDDRVIELPARAAVPPTASAAGLPPDP